MDAIPVGRVPMSLPGVRLVETFPAHVALLASTSHIVNTLTASGAPRVSTKEELVLEDAIVVPRASTSPTVAKEAVIAVRLACTREALAQGDATIVLVSEFSFKTVIFSISL